MASIRASKRGTARHGRLNIPRRYLGGAGDLCGVPEVHGRLQRDARVDPCRPGCCVSWSTRSATKWATTSVICIAQAGDQGGGQSSVDLAACAQHLMRSDGVAHSGGQREHRLALAPLPISGAPMSAAAAIELGSGDRTIRGPALRAPAVARPFSCGSRQGRWEGQARIG